MSYGMEVYASSGTKIITIDSRVTRFVANGTTGSIANGSNTLVAVSGLANTDTWLVLVEPTTTTLLNQFNFTVAKLTGQFRITNNTGVSMVFNWSVMNTG